MMEPTPFLMGALLGGLYALLALGLSLVFGVMRIINVAHGDFVLLATYLAYALFTYAGVDPFLSLCLLVPAMFLFGFIVQRYLFSRFLLRSAEAALIVAFGMSLVIQNLHQILWSPMSRGLTTPYSLKALDLGQVFIPFTYLLDFLVSLGAMVALHAFLSKTFLGKAIRAASQDLKAAQMVGINYRTVFAVSFGIAMVTAAMAGICLGLTFPFNPQSGVSFLIIAFGVVIIGGLGSMIGTFLGGVILGVAQVVSAELLGSAAQMLVVYALVLLILALRPQGLFGVR